MTPRRFLYILGLVTALAMTVVWQSAALRGTGYRLEELRSQIAEQRAEQAIHRAHLSKLKNPRRILALAEWLGLDLEERAVTRRAIAGGTAPVTALADVSGLREPTEPIP